jgi:hypothetical protein
MVFDGDDAVADREPLWIDRSISPRALSPQT